MCSRTRAENGVTAEPAVFESNGSPLRSPAARSADRTARVIFQVAIKQGRRRRGVDIKTTVTIREDGGSGCLELRVRIERNDTVAVFSKLAVLELCAAAGKQAETRSIIVEMTGTDRGPNRNSVALTKDDSGNA